MGLKASELKLSHADLAARSPVPRSPSINNGFLGFHTDPNVKGVRVFVGAHIYGGEAGMVRLELGLDVPCDRIDDYLEDHWPLYTEVITNVTRYCRVHVFSFIRHTTNRAED